MLHKIKYYFLYSLGLFARGFTDFFFNKARFKSFTSFVNDYKISYELKSKSAYLPQVELGAIESMKDKKIEITIENWNFRQGNMTLFELYCICALAKAYNPLNILEIGTFDGQTAYHLALNTGAQCKIHTIDLPPEELGKTKYNIASGDSELIEKKGFESGTRLKNSPFKDRIIQYFVDSAKFDYSALQNKIDIAFIDGAHSYFYIKSDTENILEILKPRGIILWHDYGSVLDVAEYLNELSRNLKLIRIKDTSLVMFKGA